MQLLCPLTQAPRAGETQASCPLITSGPPPNPAPTAPAASPAHSAPALWVPGRTVWSDVLETAEQSAEWTLLTSAPPSPRLEQHSPMMMTGRGSELQAPKWSFLWLLMAAAGGGRGAGSRPGGTGEEGRLLSLGIRRSLPSCRVTSQWPQGQVQDPP